MTEIFGSDQLKQRNSTHKKKIHRNQNTLVGELAFINTYFLLQFGVITMQSDNLMLPKLSIRFQVTVGTADSL